MLDEVLRTVLACHIVMSYDVGLFKIKSVAEIGAETDQRGIGLRLEPAVLCGVTALDRERVIISVVRSVGYLLRRYALDYLSIESYDKMAAGMRPVAGFQALEIVPVVHSGSARVSGVVNYDAFYLF